MNKKIHTIQFNLDMEAIRAQMKKVADADGAIKRKGELDELNTLIGNRFTPTEVGALLYRLTNKMDTSEQRAADLAFELQEKGISFQ